MTFDPKHTDHSTLVCAWSHMINEWWGQDGQEWWGQDPSVSGPEHWYNMTGQETDGVVVVMLNVKTDQLKFTMADM